MTSKTQFSLKGRELTQKFIRPPFSMSGDFDNDHEWIKGALICTRLKGLIIAMNIILALVASVVGPSRRVTKGQFQMIELYNGNCTESNLETTGLHLLINILSALLLGARKYVMQCLGAPSRKDIEAAH